MAEWISAAALVVLITLVLWRTGAPLRQIALVIGAVVLGILATAAFWDFFEGRE